MTTADVQMVTVTVDGIEVTVPKDTLIIRAAEQAGIQVPRFCDHPLLDPIGACRQCIVEVEGQRKPVASCTVAVADGMAIKTQLSSPVAAKAQAGTIEFLLLNHPLDCPICDKGGECPLQNQALANGAAESRFRDEKRTYEKPIAISSQVLLDRERCVLCARCTRFSQQIAGDPFIELFERGALEQVAIYEDEPFSSYFSGNTVQICPVGALTGAQYRFRARPFDLVSTPSVCEHCASGCQQRTDWRRGKVMRRLAGDDPTVNEEWNCDKGRWAFQYASAKTRLSSPLTRDDEGYVIETTWTEALASAAAGLKPWKGKVGVLTGGRLTVEDAYAYSKFARIVLGTDDIDFRAREHSVEERDFLATQVAGRYLDTTYDDIAAAPSVLLVGLEPEEESPILLLRLRKAAAKGGCQVFSITSWATPALRKVAGQLIATPPGGEGAVLASLAKPGGGSDDVAKAAAESLKKSGSVILVGERAATSPGALSAAVALAEATGAKLAWVPRRAGDRGAVDAGCLPGLLPGGRPLTDPAAREQLGAAWPGLLPTAPGRDTTEILTAAASGEIALVIAGVDPEDLPDPALALLALENAPFVLSLEISESAVTDRADVVLPVAPVVEKAGSYLDWEGRVRPFDATLESTGAIADRRVLDRLAGEFGVDLGLADVNSAQREIAALGAWTGDRAMPSAVEPATTPSPSAGSAVLASWHQLLDDGRLQSAEPFLEGTRRPAVARLSAATAAEVKVADGEMLRVHTATGDVIVPLVITEMPDRVVWLPMFSEGSHVLSQLGCGSGSVVSIAPAGVGR